MDAVVGHVVEVVAGLVVEERGVPEEPRTIWVHHVARVVVVAHDPEGLWPLVEGRVAGREFPGFDHLLHVGVSSCC